MSEQQRAARNKKQREKIALKRLSPEYRQAEIERKRCKYPDFWGFQLPPPSSKCVFPDLPDYLLDLNESEEMILSLGNPFVVVSNTYTPNTSPHFFPHYDGRIDEILFQAQYPIDFRPLVSSMKYLQHQPFYFDTELPPFYNINTIYKATSNYPLDSLTFPGHEKLDISKNGLELFEEMCFPCIYGGNERAWNTNEEYQEIAREELNSKDLRCAKSPSNIFFKYLKCFPSNIKAHRPEFSSTPHIVLKFYPDILNEMFLVLEQQMKDAGLEQQFEFTNEYKLCLMRQDYVTCARYIAFIFKKITNEIVFNKLKIFGNKHMVSEYYAETVFKPSPELHLFLWIENTPTTENEIVEFMDKHISTSYHYLQTDSNLYFPFECSTLLEPTTDNLKLESLQKTIPSYDRMSKVFQKLKISNSIYKDIVASTINVPTVFPKRSIKSLHILPYNPKASNAFNTRMSIDFITGAEFLKQYFIQEATDPNFVTVYEAIFRIFNIGLVNNSNIL
jgi:hypothetical protein